MTHLPNIDPTRHGPWLATFTRGAFWPLDPRASEVHLEDIAHALAMRCRYGGACKRFYSVAEHSVLVSQLVAPEHAMWGLLHDAAEAYTADVPSPLKQCLPGWKSMEDRIMHVIAERFGLDAAEPAEVKAIDKRIVTDERAALMEPGDREWAQSLPAVGARIVGLPPEQAEAAFLARFSEIGAQRVKPFVDREARRDRAGATAPSPLERIGGSFGR